MASSHICKRKYSTQPVLRKKKYKFHCRYHIMYYKLCGNFEKTKVYPCTSHIMIVLMLEYLVRIKVLIFREILWESSLEFFLWRIKQKMHFATLSLNSPMHTFFIHKSNVMTEIWRVYFLLYNASNTLSYILIVFIQIWRYTEFYYRNIRKHSTDIQMRRQFTV